MENEEVIRRQMEHTRESLTDKLETLEDKLLHSVQQATSAVTETVAKIRNPRTLMRTRVKTLSAH